MNHPTYTVFCDRHPLQKMDWIVITQREPEPKRDADAFKCPQCNRVYIWAEHWGYADYVAHALIPSADSQLRCSQHNIPMYLAAFELNGDESPRTWKCAGCREVLATIGESLLECPQNDIR
jgi:hypothetical protein